MALVAATALGAYAFGAPLGAGLAAAGIALVVAALGLVLGRPRRWSTRIAFALLLAYLAVWGYVRLEQERLDRRAPAAAERLAVGGRERVARALEQRLQGDLALAGETARRLDRATAHRGPGIVQEPDLFLALGAAAPPRLPPGVGLEVYDPDGGLRAWWGDPRGERLPPDSMRLATGGAVVRRPAGFTVAYAAAPWLVGRDTFRVAVKDVWLIESPLGREVVEPGLLLPTLESRHFVAFRVAPGAAMGEPVAGPGGAPVATVADARFLLDRWLAERRETTARMMALLFLWPLVWSAGAAWHVARRVRNPALGAAAQAGVVGALWLFLVGTRYPVALLPSAWFSPLAFASTAFGPAGRSAGHFVLTAALTAALAFSLYGRAPARGGTPLRWGGAALLGAAMATGAVRLAGPALESAMRNMSPPVFFSPTLLFSPPFLMVLVGFALVAAVVIALLAILFRVADMPTGKGWVAAAAAVVGPAAGVAAWSLPRAAMAGSRGTLALLVAAGLAGAGWLAHAAARRRAPAIRLALVGTTLGALLTMPLAAHARVQAAQDLLVERAARIGEASVPWLQYTLERTREFLEREPAVAQAIVERSPDAALVLWSRSPLRELDFATALFLFDAERQPVSRFSLADQDLTDQALAYVDAVGDAPFGITGSEGATEARWAVVPIAGPQGRVGTAVAMTTGALELRDEAPGRGFVLTDLLAGGGLTPDVPGYTTLGPEETPPPHTLLTSVRRGEQTIRLAMPLDPLLPGARGYAVFALVAALAGLAIGTIVRLGDMRARARWWAALRTQNPLRSFRVQLLLAFLTIAMIPLVLYAVIGYRHTQVELESATRSASADALAAASRMLVSDPALEQGTARALSDGLRQIGDVLQQDLILYWRGWTIASSRPEIFASRLFADRMAGQVYTELFAVGRPTVFDRTTLGDRSFLVAYQALSGAGASAGYVIATPLLLREDRVRIDLQQLGEGVFLLSALSLGFLLAVAWGLARFMTGPLAALEQATRQIAAGRLSYRLEAPARRDEFGRLQRAFNAMATRLDASQKELEREKSRVQAILESVGAGVVALDGRGRVRLLNERAETLLGVRAGDVLHRSAADLAEGGDQAARFWRLVARDFERGRRADRDLVVRIGGEERHYHLVSTSLRDGTGEERGLVVAFEDITANIHSQRVIAWGEMARQVAHEIKNPLTPMKLSLQHLERTMDDRSGDFERVFHENLALVLSEIDRLERIAGNFARFAVPDPTTRAPFDALAVARDAVTLFETGEEPVRYALETVGEPAPLLGEPEGFRRALVNLLRNARDAVLGAGGGGVTVALDWEREPGWAWISVVDDGVGVPGDAVERLFEPSFSTKTSGAGLGLAITRRIVEAWDGSIAWEPREPRGTAFHVRLRVAAASSSEEAAP